jgi:large subunit ribosomal protein L30
VPQKTRTIHIKWVRSGIGFSRKQKEMVRSIGLHRLNQVVERPDTPHFRGLVAKVSHLVEVVEPPSKPSWVSTPEYTIIPAEAQISKPTAEESAVTAAPPESETAEKSEGSSRTSAVVEEVKEVEEVDEAAPRKKPAAAKGQPAESSSKKASAKSEKPKTRGDAKAAKTPAKKTSKPTKGKK